VRETVAQFHFPIVGAAEKGCGWLAIADESELSVFDPADVSEHLR